MRGIIFFIILLLTLPVAAQAQEDDTNDENYTFEQGVTFTYPSEWTIIDEEPGIVLVGGEKYQALVLEASELALISFQDTRLDNVLGSYFNYVAVNIPYDPSLLQEDIFEEDSDTPREVMVYAYDDDKEGIGLVVAFPFGDVEATNPEIGLVHLLVEGEELVIEDYEQLVEIAVTYRPGPLHVIPGSSIINGDRRSLDCTLYAAKSGMSIYDAPDGSVIAEADPSATYDALELITLEDGEEWYSIAPDSFGVTEVWVNVAEVDPASSCLG